MMNSNFGHKLSAGNRHDTPPENLNTFFVITQITMKIGRLNLNCTAISMHFQFPIYLHKNTVRTKNYFSVSEISIRHLVKSFNIYDDHANLWLIFTLLTL